MKKVWRKTLSICLTAAILIASVNPLQANAAWRSNSTGWWWEEANGGYPAGTWKQLNGNWYHFNASGYMESGWQYINGNWYYLGEANDGSMKTGWQYINGNWYYLGGANDGAMKTGWQQVNGTWYYMYDSGAMAANTWIGSYYVDASGAWTTSSGGGAQEDSTGAKWIQSGGRWWYRHADGGCTINGWESINGNWYYFDKDGWMLSGWQEIDGFWYYLGGDGAMRTGWQEVNGNWFYMFDNGRMASDTWIGNSYVNVHGAWIPGAAEGVYTIDLGNGQTKTVTGHFDGLYAQKVVDLVNQYRAENGLNGLAVEANLSAAANIRATEISHYFEHTRPNGTSCFTAITGGNFWGEGENIASGFGTPEAVMVGWKNSPGHNANMLRESWDYIGVGVFAEKTGYGYRYYWVQLFGYKASWNF